MQVVADVGGIPGKDCNGFCKYCYFRKVKDVKVFGCAHCLPNKIGCERCSKGVSETQGAFKTPFEVMNQVQSLQKRLQMKLMHCWEPVHCRCWMRQDTIMLIIPQIIS